MKAVVAPMAIAGVGILLSIVGVYLVKTKEGATQRDLLGALSRGINSSAAMIVVAGLGVLFLLGIDNLWGIWGAMVAGLITGIIIGRSTEYYTSATYGPTRRIAAAAEGGPATAIIAGIGVGMLSTVIPVLAVAAGTMAAFLFAAEFDVSQVSLGSTAWPSPPWACSPPSALRSPATPTVPSPTMPGAMRR
jgi:K(+)-stimulated pyrophosphate-energized sodium pump